MLPEATAALYRRNQRRQVATLAGVRAEWARMGADLDAGWAQHGPRIVGLVSAAMTGAASDGATAVPAALEETGHPVAAEARVVPAAFGRAASDGRDLPSLLYGGVVRARSTPGPLALRLLTALGFLNLAVRTQISDATRAGSSVAIAVRPGVGWVRMVNPPCCKDCAVLAGRWYRWSDGFERHHRCDCVHRPAHESEGPEGYVERIDPLTDIHDLTDGERQALADGGDLGRIANARRMTKAGGPGGRMTPDDIYQRAGGDREQALTLLRANGFIR